MYKLDMFIQICFQLGENEVNRDWNRGHDCGIGLFLCVLLLV